MKLRYSYARSTGSCAKASLKLRHRLNRLQSLAPKALIPWLKVSRFKHDHDHRNLSVDM